MRTLLVDDEPLARRELLRLLQLHPWIKVIGEARHAGEAVEQIDLLKPALVFLDIEMPGGTGFDVLTRAEHTPRVIFATAYDAFAVRAFEVNALDYLLKPIEPERLAKALGKVTPEAGAAQGEGQAGLTPLTRVFVKDGERCWFIALSDVRLIASEGNYVTLHVGSDAPMLAKSLSRLEERLDPEMFFRANRQALIDLNFIERVEPGGGGCLLVTLRGGPEVEISRRQARAFRAKMGT